MCINGPVQFKPMLFKGELYIFIVEHLGNTEKHKEEKSCMILPHRDNQYKHFGAYPS